jgi:hypothetical protein
MNDFGHRIKIGQVRARRMKLHLPASEKTILFFCYRNGTKLLLKSGCDGHRKRPGGARWSARRGWACAHTGRANASAAGQIAGRHYLSREEHHVLFSAGELDCGERGVVTDSVLSWQNQTLTPAKDLIASSSIAK